MDSRDNGRIMWAKSTAPQEGKTMEYKIISGDGHIDLRWLPHDLFVSHAPAQWKDQVPHVRDTPTGKHWFAEGRDLTTRPFGTLATTELPKRGESKHVDRMYDMGFYDGQSHPTTPALRLKDQEIDGIDAEVMYGILGIGLRMQDRELIQIVYEIYNDWAADFCKSNPRRFVGLACIPSHDPAAAAAELRRAARLGLKGADFAVSTAAYPIWHGAWDPLWQAAQECRIPISFHTTGYPAPPAPPCSRSSRPSSLRASSSRAPSIASRSSSSCSARPA